MFKNSFDFLQTFACPSSFTVCFAIAQMSSVYIIAL
jgi:hypothetical protein